MPDLIAQGPEAQQRWRRTLPEGEAVVLGRLGGAWAVPWDRQVSRHHARLLWTGRQLEVVRLPEGKNPVFLRGTEVERCPLVPGEHFVIGQTTFTLADQQVNVTADAPAPVQQQSFSAQYLKQVQFRNPDHRIEVLSRLPDVISGAAGDQELFVRLVSMLLAGVPRADAAAVVAVEPTDEDREEDEAREPSPVGPARVLHWDQRLAIAAQFPPQPESDPRIARGSGRACCTCARTADLLGRPNGTVPFSLHENRDVPPRIVHRQRRLRLGVLHARARQGVPGLGPLRRRAVQRRAVRADALDRSDRPARRREVHRAGGGHAQFAAADAAPGAPARHA